MESMLGFEFGDFSETMPKGFRYSQVEIIIVLNIFLLASDLKNN